MAVGGDSTTTLAILVDPRALDGPEVLTPVVVVTADTVDTCAAAATGTVRATAVVPVVEEAEAGDAPYTCTAAVVLRVALLLIPSLRTHTHIHTRAHTIDT